MHGVVIQRIERALPDPDLRQSMLAKFAESMARIRHRRPDWCLIRFHGRHIRLFAGRLIVMTLEGDSIWLTTDPSARSANFSRLRSWRWDEKSYPRYRRVVSRNGYYTPSLDTGNDWSVICGSHFAYLDRVLSDGTAPDWRTSVKHEPLVADYIDALLSERAPTPSGDFSFDPMSVIDARDRIPTSIVLRQGQSAFRQNLLRVYGARCAFSGCEVEQVLDAAHIVPYRGRQTNHVQNGLLLRTDLHTLFDLGLLAVDSSTMTVLVAPPLARTEYAELHRRLIRSPSNRDCRPSVAALDEHRRRSQVAADA